LRSAQTRECERQLAGALMLDGIGNERATRLSQRFQPRRDVDAVTVDPGLVVEHISQIDPDAKPHAATLGHPLVALGHHGLHLDCTLGGAYDAGKFSHDAIAGGVDDPPAVPADQRQDSALRGVRVAPGGGLVLVHEPAVPRDIGGKKGGEPALYRGLFVHDRSLRSHRRADGSVAHRPADGEDGALAESLVLRTRCCGAPPPTWTRFSRGTKPEIFPSS